MTARPAKARPLPLAVAGLVALPRPALPEAGATLRPGSSAGMPASAWTEALHRGPSLPALALLIATAVAVRFRSPWGGLGVTVLWSVLVAVVVWRRFGDDPTGLRKSAIEEGCLVSPTLFVAAVTAICIALILYTAPERRQTSR